MNLKVLSTDLRLLAMRARMPFKYGIATMTALPHAFLFVRVRVGNREVQGVAADHLPPKWFTKDPDARFSDEVEAMREVIRHAAAAAQGAAADTVFELWREVYRQQAGWAPGAGHPPLLAGFGVSLVERAVIDAVCRAEGTPFAQAIRAGRLGLDLGALHPELNGAAAAEFLPERPLRSLTVRHTVGLSDPLTDADIPADQRLDDGLPQSLEACIQSYGIDHFKVKLCGDVETDRDRLGRLAAIVPARCDTWTLTVDGNEQYRQVAPLAELWRTLREAPEVARFLDRTHCIEQPLHRDVALTPEVGRDLAAWQDHPPVIIDESDGEPDTARRAIDLGYAGTSHKNCKGVFKGVANRCLIEARRRAGAAGLVMAAEDLANVGPVALLQDLAVVATLGIEHAERNGHHYFAGLSMLDPELRETVLAAHGDLYERREPGVPALAIRAGRIELASVVDAPFGRAFELDPDRFTPDAEWTFDRVGLDEGGGG